MAGPVEETEQRASETADLAEDETHPWVALVWKVILTWIGHLGVIALIATLVYGAAAPFFDWLDEATLRWLFTVYSDTGARWAEVVSVLGQPYVVVPLLLCALGVVFAFATVRDAFFLFLVYFFAGADYLILNQAFSRPRPHLFSALPEPTGFGTPSGHATATMALFASLAIIGLRHFGRSGAVIAACCGLTFFAVGLTRVYLQVHYPTDVLLAWIVTGTWIWIVHALLFEPGNHPSPSARRDRASRAR